MVENLCGKHDSSVYSSGRERQYQWMMKA